MSKIFKAANLPTYDRFKPKAPITKPLTTAQELVEANLKEIEAKERRRRDTLTVKNALLQEPIQIGSTIWIPDSLTVWKMVEISAFDDKFQLTVKVDGKETHIDLREMEDLYKVNPRVTNDMTSLYYIHEAGILENLRLRSKDDIPYTMMANVLIAVNPLMRLVQPKIQDYVQTQMGEQPPHPYSIAEVSFQQMALRTPAQCQSIVISGESGSGKTETSKIILRYLTTREYVSSNEAWDDKTSELDKRLVDTNPILEAFGNAKTLRNHNSSRFGKFMKLQFSPTGKRSLVGAYIETYLLEKSRVVHQIPGERNFHMFYFLLAGATDEQTATLSLKNISEYRYLNQSGCTTDPNIDDEILFDEVIAALETVNIDSKKQLEIFTILSGILQLGNVTLLDKESREGDEGYIISPDALASAAKLLGVDYDLFEKVICRREITTRGEVFTIKRNAKEGGYVRDAIAKSIYHHLFGWIVYQINEALGHGPATLPFIGVLDIFGFESFDFNDFEQLLINYANEVLQATFNQQVFIAESELFKSEGIEVADIKWPDNRDCIELISKKPSGVLPLLDTEAQTQQPSGEKWNAMLHKNHTGNPHFLDPHKKDQKYIFIIKHFATKVAYTVTNFIDKNNDTIPKDLEDFVMSSSLPFMHAIFTISTEGEINSTTTMRSRETVSSKFVKQMKVLVDTLDATRCNFIRCVKPNASMTYGEFDNGYVVDQLRCTGMLATCELLKVGLPTRVSYAEICAIYKPVLPEKVTPMFAPYTDRTFTEAVLWAFRVEPTAYRLGRTKVFFKTGKIALLDALLKVDMKKMGPWIVSRLRKWLARRRWRYATAKILGQKGFLWLLHLIQKRQKSILQIQSAFRMFQVRKRFLVRRASHREKARKKALAKKRWKKAIFATLARNRFKRLFQGIHAQRLEKEKKRNAAATQIQAMMRGKLGRSRAEKYRSLAQDAAWRKRLALEQAVVAQQTALKVRRKWRSSALAIVAQRHFCDRLKRIRLAHAAAEAAKQRERLEKAEAEQRAKNRRNEAAIQIQKVFRGSRGREQAREVARQAIFAAAQAAALEAALAADEALRAAQAAEEALKREANALQSVDQHVNSSFPARVGSLPKESMLKAHGELGQVDEDEAIASSSSEMLLNRHDSLEQVDLSWMADGNVDKLDLGEEVVEEADTNRNDELKQAGRDLYGEGGETMDGPLLAAEDEILVNPVETMQEFATGPPIPFRGGVLTCTMFGHRKQQNQSWGEEYTEYVLRCTWGRNILEQSKTAWLVGGRYNDFNALHQELKSAAAGVQGKRPSWFPRFPKRYPFSSLIGKNQEEKFIHKREKELNRYMTQVLTQMPDALLNIHMDRFLNLTLRTQDICEREAYAEAKKRWEEEERQAMANAAGAEPLNEVELHEVEQLVRQLLEKVLFAQGDLRQDSQLQEMIHAVKVLQPRVTASAQIGAGVNMELVPLSMQLQDDIQDVFTQYNDNLLALRLGQRSA